MRSRLLLLPMLALLALPGCLGPTPPAPAPVAAAPYPPVPAPLREEQPKPPVSEDPLVWQIGHWEWEGSGYVWVHGEWVKLGGHSNEYLPGHWADDHGQWKWVPGHWL